MVRVVYKGAMLFMFTAFAHHSLAQTPPPAPPLPTGHFQIVMSTLSGEAVFLLDTDTGRIWQLTRFTTLQGQPAAWVGMSVLSSSADYATFYRNNPPASAAASPNP